MSQVEISLVKLELAELSSNYLSQVEMNWVNLKLAEQSWN